MRYQLVYNESCFGLHNVGLCIVRLTQPPPPPYRLFPLTPCPPVLRDVRPVLDILFRGVNLITSYHAIMLIVQAKFELLSQIYSLGRFALPLTVAGRR